MNKNIYLIGEVRGSYRSQNIVKYLLDKGYFIFYNSLELELFKGKKNLFYRVTRKFFRSFHLLIRFAVSVYYIIICDKVILLAMCNDRQTELKIARILWKKIYVDFYISFYDTLVRDRKLIPYNSYQALRRFNWDLNCLNYSYKVFFLNKTEASYYLNIFNLKFLTHKHLILPLCSDQFNSYKDNFDFNKKKFVICWWGSFIPLHGLENLIQAFKLLLEKEFDFHVFLFGNDEEKSIPYKRHLKLFGLENFVTVDNTKSFANGLLEPFLVNNCDLALGNFGDSEKAKNVIVNKLIDSVALKLPVLMGESFATKEFFSEDDIFYSLNSPESIANKIYEISFIESEIIKQRINKSYKIYEANFSVKSFVKNLDIYLD